MPRRRLASLLATAALLSPAYAADTVEDARCGCFLSNGTNPGYYIQHAFFDFRQLSQYTSSSVPPVIEDTANVASAPVTSDYFTSDPWASVWRIQTWERLTGNAATSGRSKKGPSTDATVHMINSASNIYIEKAGSNDGIGNDNSTLATFLTMRTRRLKDFQTAAEFESASGNYRFASLRMLARTVGAPGACTAMFTYHGSDNPAKVQEADIEILTKDPVSVIQYTNQPSDLPDTGEILEATRNATLPKGLLWSDWAVHRLDWTPERSVWYVNEFEVASIQFQVPRDGSTINFNAWSDGGSWTGNMTKDTEAFLQIQWIEILYNNTDIAKRSADGSTDRSTSEIPSRLVRRASGCKAVCTVDGTTSAGKAALLSNSTESSAARSSIVGSAPVGGIVALGWAIAGIIWVVL
ncbi:hypothetical protein NQ176_g4665 [Zarea fungicola]|uniref:Uncharacterized protein n=1 Tax=Zarea fungicola TaxID=93591 RepID=A0ACC1NCB8_9HYPO|nr:hypothetical protein NQ176_g4665 [Lecanicillium fungicola]